MGWVGIQRPCTAGGLGNTLEDLLGPCRDWSDLRDFDARTDTTMVQNSGFDLRQKLTYISST